MNIRRFGLILCATLAALTLPNYASAQEQEPPSQFERVKDLAPLRGMWVLGEEGDESARGFRINSNWAANRSYLQMQFVTTGDEGREHRGTMTIGWSAADNGLVAWSFWPDSQTMGKVSIDGNKVHLEPHGMTVDGKKTSAEVTMEVDGDTLNIKVRNARRGEEDRPDMDLALKRRERRVRQQDSE